MDLTVEPKVVDVYVDGDLVERGRVELSYRATREDEKAEVMGIYVEGGDWICDCPDKDTAEALVYAMLLFSDLTVRGMSREGWANTLEKRAAFLLSEARIARAQIPAESKEYLHG